MLATLGVNISHSICNSFMYICISVDVKTFLFITEMGLVTYMYVPSDTPTTYNTKGTTMKTTSDAFNDDTTSVITYTTTVAATIPSTTAIGDTTRDDTTHKILMHHRLLIVVYRIAYICCLVTCTCTSTCTCTCSSGTLHFGGDN